MQGIRDMLTQRQTQYVWETYLKHRKHGKIEHPEDEEKTKPTQASLRSGEGKGVGHNKVGTKKGN